MTTEEQTSSESPVGRRQLLRGGAILSGAAGIAVAGGALAAPTAQAADGDPVVLGGSNDAESATSLTIGAAAGSVEPTLTLTNADGPALSLSPLPEDWAGELSPGQIANTFSGPLIGVRKDQDTITTPLLTEQDVWLPFILPTPMRLVDTRTEEGRSRIALPRPLARDGRLPARRSMTFWIAPTGQGFGIPAVHLTLTVVGPLTGGHLTLYPGPDRPATSTLNFGRGQTLANSAFIGTSTGTYTLQGDDPNEPPQVAEAFVVTIYTTADAWIVVDATGAYATGFNPLEPPDGSARRAAQARRASPAIRAQRAFGHL